MKQLSQALSLEAASRSTGNSMSLLLLVVMKLMFPCGAMLFSRVVLFSDGVKALAVLACGLLLIAISPRGTHGRRDLSV